MRLTSKGLLRTRKIRRHFTDTNVPFPPKVNDDETHPIRITVESDRRYHLYLSADDIITCLLTLPPSCIANAVLNAGDNIDLAEKLPEVLKQLAWGAIPAKAASVAD